MCIKVTPLLKISHLELWMNNSLKEIPITTTISASITKSVTPRSNRIRFSNSISRKSPYLNRWRKSPIRIGRKNRLRGSTRERMNRVGLRKVKKLIGNRIISSNLKAKWSKNEMCQNMNDLLKIIKDHSLNLKLRHWAARNSNLKLWRWGSNKSIKISLMNRSMNGKSLQCLAIIIHLE